MLEDRPAPRSSGQRSSGGGRGGRGGRGPVATCLAVIGALTVLACIGCLAITAFSLPRIGDAFEDFMLTVTADPNMSQLGDQLSTLGAPGFMETVSALLPGMTQAAPQGAATLPAPASSSSGASMPSDLVGRGTINKGETVGNTVEIDRDDAWTFSADAGEHVIIELTSGSASFDPHLYLYDGSRALVAENDDIDGANNANSRIEITLANAGKYTIRVGKFSGGGAYTLSLN
jgi:hypothetical protein